MLRVPEGIQVLPQGSWFLLFFIAYLFPFRIVDLLRFQTLTLTLGTTPLRSFEGLLTLMTAIW